MTLAGNNRQRTMNGFCSCTAEKTRELFALETYMEKYGMGDGKNPDLRRHREEFDDWTLDAQVGNESIEVLCCPEEAL